MSVPLEEELKTCKRVFGYGSNHPGQLAKRLETTEESIISRSVAGIVPGYTRCYSGKSKNWGNGSVATIEKYVGRKLNESKLDTKA